MTSPELQEFLAILRSSDQQTIESLLNRLDPALRRIIRLRLADPRLRRVLDTADVFQSLLKDFLFQNHRDPSPAEAAAGLSAYLSAAVRYKIHTKLRKERRHLGTLTDDSRLVSSEMSAARQVEHREFIEAVRQRLSDDRRFLFDLTARGLTWTEISHKLGGKPDALRMRLRRAIADALRELGEKELGHA